MCSRSLVVSLAFVFCACGAANKPQVVSITPPTDKPYLTLSDSCAYDSETDTVVCEGEGFRQGLSESVEQSRALRKLKRELDAKDAHTNVSSWFLKGQLAEEKAKRLQAEDDKWEYLGWGAGGGVLIGVITTALCFILGGK